MSISYHLQHSKTFDELIKKIRERGDTLVDVFLTSQEVPKFFGVNGCYYFCNVGVKFGKTRLRLTTLYAMVISNFGYQKDFGKVIVERAAYDAAVTTAENLQKLGIEATINQEPADNTKNMIPRIDVGIEAMMRRYGRDVKKPTIHYSVSK